MKQFYRFGSVTDGSAADVDLLGGKGAHLAEMANLGIPVPPGFTIPTTTCIRYSSGDLKSLEWESLLDQYMSAASEVESEVGGPCLFSVRSGARVSMPGMMDTVLNVGLTEKNLSEWKKALGTRAALDSYRRLVQMFGEVVKGIAPAKFSDILDSIKQSSGVEHDSELKVKHLYEVLKQFKAIYTSETGEPFPNTLEDQLGAAIRAVFDSWDNPRAQEYRKHYGIPDDWGTAVNVQAMAFGNRNDKSCTGVLFTRNPATGDASVMGEWLPNAQGEDVVAGVRTPRPLSELEEWNTNVMDQLLEYAWKLEDHYGDMQDIEFTVEDGNLFILQTRRGKRTPVAALRIAGDLISNGGDAEKLLGAIHRNDPLSISGGEVLEPGDHDCKGIPAGGGPVCGLIALNAVMAVKMAAEYSDPIILVSAETTPDDLPGMLASAGFLTKLGGSTSHAAVVARGLGKACVVGANDINVKPGFVTHLGVDYHAGSPITIDGDSGKIWFSQKAIKRDSCDGEIYSLMRKVVDRPLRGFKPEHVGVYGRTVIDMWAWRHLPEKDPAVKEALHRLRKLDCEFVFDIRVVQQDGDVSAFMAQTPETLERKMYQWLYDAGLKGVILSNTAGLCKGTTYLREAGIPRTVADVLAGAVVSSDDWMDSLFGSKEAYNTVSAAMENAGTPFHVEQLDEGVGMYEFIDQYFGE